MNPLPQRRKSAEEIAKLRETLGVPPSAGSPEAPPPMLPRAATPPPSSQPTPAAAFAPPPKPAPIRRNEPAERAPAEPAVVVLKPTRSLRRSEQTAVVRPLAGPSSSPLPARRRSEQEIMELRRREAPVAQSPAEKLRQLTAHPAVVGAGYLVAVAAALLAWQAHSPVPGGMLTVAALAIAGWLGLRKVRSRHHAAFIFLIALFTGVFGGLHHFGPKPPEEPVPAEGSLSALLAADRPTPPTPGGLTDEQRAMLLKRSEESDPPEPAQETPAEDPDAP